MSQSFFFPCLSTERVPIFLKVQSIVSCVQWPAFQFPARNALLSGLIDRPFHIICLFRQNPSRGLLQFSFFFFSRQTLFFIYFFSNKQFKVSLPILFILGTLLLTWHYLLSLREGHQKTDKTDHDAPQATVGFQFIYIHTNHYVFFCNITACAIHAL